VDGIFGGSAESYVRDLQWKAFAPELYSMSGWAPTDKRPWLYGETATEINRKYLQMRQELMPYIYSLAVDASNTGVGMMRTMPLEFPTTRSPTPRKPRRSSSWAATTWSHPSPTATL